MVKKNKQRLIKKMDRSEIKKISLKKISDKPINEIKNILKENYEISYGEYDDISLKKAIDNNTPFFINNHFVIGYEPKTSIFIGDDEQRFPIERMVKAVIVEDIISPENESLATGDPFVIMGKNEWKEPIFEFESTFGDLKVGMCILPPHSAVFNFLDPKNLDKEERKERVVSCLIGININIYDRDNYIDNCFHEIGHLFWRDMVTPREKKRFEHFHQLMRPTALFEYEWEKHDKEEVFCTLYKWYLKGHFLHKSFMNIFEFEEPQGLALLQSVFDRIRDDKIQAAEWAAKEDEITEYFNPKKDPQGRVIQRKGIVEELSGMTVPLPVLSKAVDSFRDGKTFMKIGDNAFVGVDESERLILDNQKRRKPYQNIEVVYVDQDGVLADFTKGFIDMFGKDPHDLDAFTVRQYCLSKPDFFSLLPPIEDGIAMVKKLAEKRKVVILTTPMEGMEYCKLDKIAWIRQYLGDGYDIVFSDKKYEFVDDSTSVLIDDMDYNLKPWTDAGGTAIKYPGENIVARVEAALNPKAKKISVKVDGNPTDAQKVSGNYKKGNIEFMGLKILVENVPGSIRSGIGETGRKWVTKMKDYYGYIKGTQGADCDPVDVFINPESKSRSLVFVINQLKPDGTFDEIKCMLGYDTEESAVLAYLSNYEKGWERNIKSVVRTNTKKLRTWLKEHSPIEPFE